MVKFCKRPFKIGDEFGVLKQGVVQEYREYDTPITATGFHSCGIWEEATQETDPNLFFYICKRCLQAQGILW